MKIHEYQGKEVFQSFSIPTPRGYLIKDIDSAEKIIKEAHDEFKSIVKTKFKFDVDDVEMTVIGTCSKHAKK